MKSREDTARFIEDEFENHTCQRYKGQCHHYGWQELRELMDFIYNGGPVGEAEMLTNRDAYRKRKTQ
jgi:hypothetical protein